jgi:hypothetical protein
MYVERIIGTTAGGGGGKEKNVLLDLYLCVLHLLHQIFFEICLL